VTHPRPVALVTSVVTDYRREPFRMLAEAEGVEVLAFEDPGPPVEGLPIRATSQVGAARLVASGRYRAVVCGLGGRLALPGVYLAARRARVPFVLWASIWSHPRTPAHVLSYLPTLALYRNADAVVTYGPHVTRYVAERRGRGGDVFEAPQAVSADEFGREVPDELVAAARERAGAGEGDFLALFVGRLVREKGVGVLLDAWRRAALGERAALALVGEGPLRALAEEEGDRVRVLGRLPRAELPALYAAADTLVLPSLRTATFTEPWGFVVNEAMHQGTPILASDAVGAVAGGLVVDGRNGLVAPQGDAEALAVRMRAAAANTELRERLGRAAREDVGRYTYAAWVEGVRGALRAVGTSSGGGSC
jgi:glycosyltransferase involved in cell wall biosynthesis